MTTKISSEDLLDEISAILKDAVNHDEIRSLSTDDTVQLLSCMMYDGDLGDLEAARCAFDDLKEATSSLLHRYESLETELRRSRKDLAKISRRIVSFLSASQPEQNSSPVCEQVVCLSERVDDEKPRGAHSLAVGPFLSTKTKRTKYLKVPYEMPLAGAIGPVWPPFFPSVRFDVNT